MKIINLQLQLYVWLLIDDPQNKCGNFFVEDGEQCDTGLNSNDTCCDDRCMFNTAMDAVCRFVCSVCAVCFVCAWADLGKNLGGQAIRIWNGYSLIICIT